MDGFACLRVRRRRLSRLRCPASAAPEEVAKTSHEGSCISHWCSLYTVFYISSQTDSGLWELFLSKKFSHGFASAVLAQDKTVAKLFLVHSHRGRNYKPLLLCTVLSLPIDSILLSSFQRWLISCYLWLPQGFGLWSSDPCISSPWSSTSDSTAVTHVAQSLVRKMHIRFWVHHTYVCASYTNFPGYRLRVPLWLTAMLRPISCGILERHRHEKKCWIDRITPKMPHECLLPAT